VTAREDVRLAEGRRRRESGAGDGGEVRGAGARAVPEAPCRQAAAAAVTAGWQETRGGTTVRILKKGKGTWD
jgi:hypothetical protein